MEKPWISCSDLVKKILGSNAVIFRVLMNHFEFSLADKFIHHPELKLLVKKPNDGLGLGNNNFANHPEIIAAAEKWLKTSNVIRYLLEPSDMWRSSVATANPEFIAKLESSLLDIFPKTLCGLICSYLPQIKCNFCLALLFKYDEKNAFGYKIKKSEIDFISQTCSQPQLSCTKCHQSLYHHFILSNDAWYYYPQYGYGNINSSRPRYVIHQCLDDFKRNSKIYCPIAICSCCRRDFSAHHYPNSWSVSGNSLDTWLTTYNCMYCPHCNPSKKVSSCCHHRDPYVTSQDCFPLLSNEAGGWKFVLPLK